MNESLKEVLKKLAFWEDLLIQYTHNRDNATNEDSRRTWGYAIRRCEQGIQRYKAKRAEFIGKK